jgi:uncharacterized protein (DUF2147 family)
VKMWSVPIALGALLALPLLAHAEGGDAIIGQWLTDGKDARIEITKVDGKYEGKIVWLKDPLYDSKDPEAGKPVRDRDNPDAARRNDPMIGLRLLRDFEYVGKNAWKNGAIYNPENGKTYHANLTLANPKELKVRGYIGISLFGGTTIWTRYEETQPSTGAPQGTK